jgi:hypothetical protein
MKYDIPNCSIFNMWHLWHKGDLSKNIPPLKNLKQLNCNTNGDQNRLSKAKRVMNELIDISLQEGYVQSIKDFNDDMDFNSLKTIFDKSLESLSTYLTTGDISSTTKKKIKTTSKLSEATSATVCNYFPDKKRTAEDIKPNGNGITTKTKYKKVSVENTAAGITTSAAAAATVEINAPNHTATLSI